MQATLIALQTDLPLKADILICHFDTSMKDITILENGSNLIAGIEDSVLCNRKGFGTINSGKGSSNRLSSLIRNHALVISLLPETNSHMANMLAMSPCPIQFCPEPKPIKIVR